MRILSFSSVFLKKSVALFTLLLFCGSNFSLAAIQATPVENLTNTATGVTAAQVVSSDSSAQSLINNRNTVAALSLSAASLTTPHGLAYDGSYVQSDGWTVYFTGTFSTRREVERTHTDGRAYLYEYNAYGKFSKTTYYKAGNILESTTTYTYNSSQQLTQAKTLYANGTTDCFNAAGQLTKTIYADGKYRTYTYNAAGKRITDFYYNKNATRITQTQYIYDALGNLQYTDVSSYSTTNVYTGKVRTLATGQIETYDSQNRMTKKVLPDGTYTVYSNFFSNSQPGRAQYYKRYSGSFLLDSSTEYHSDARIKSISSYTYGTLSETTTYVYNASKALTGYTRSIPGRYYTYYYDLLFRLTKRLDLISGYYFLYGPEYYESLQPKTGSYYNRLNRQVSSFTYYDNLRINTAKTYSGTTVAYTDVYQYNANNEFTGAERTMADGRVLYFDAQWREIQQRTTYADGTYDLYTEYYSNGKVKSSKYYSASGTLLANNTHYDTGFLQSRTFLAPDSLGNIYILYKNENWNNTGLGRIDRTKRQAASNSELSSIYVYDGATGELVRLKYYSDANWTILLPKVREDFIEAGSGYFSLGSQIMDASSGYIYERPNAPYTQPTNLGFYAQYLADLAAGDAVNAFISQEQAIMNLQKIASSLLTDQTALGYKGLLPWLEFNGASRKRAAGAYGQQVAFVDNSNLAASLGATIGALSDLTDSRVVHIRQNLDLFLDRQEEGYRYLYDTWTQQFKGGAFISTGATFSYSVGTFGSETRTGVEFISLRYDIDPTAYEKLKATMTSYTMTDGRVLPVAKTFDGGAFQMLWTTLTMPENMSEGLSKTLRDFVDASLDYSQKKNLLGFLSAGYKAPNMYDGTAGISELAENTAAHTETFSTLYALGAAYMVSPEKVGNFLREIFIRQPGLVTTSGYLEGYNHATSSLIQEKVSANQLSFLLGIIGQGPQNTVRYFTDRGRLDRLNTLFNYGSASNANLLIESASIVQDSDYRYWYIDSATRHMVIRNSWFWDYSFSFYQNNRNIAGKTLRVRYKSKTPNLKLQFLFMNRSSSGQTFTAQSTPYYNVSGSDTTEKEILISLANTPMMSSIDRIAMFFDITPENTPVDFELTGFDLI